MAFYSSAYIIRTIWKPDKYLFILIKFRKICSLLLKIFNATPDKVGIFKFNKYLLHPFFFQAPYCKDGQTQHNELKGVCESPHLLLLSESDIFFPFTIFFSAYNSVLLKPQLIFSSYRIFLAYIVCWVETSEASHVWSEIIPLVPRAGRDRREADHYRLVASRFHKSRETHKLVLGGHKISSFPHWPPKS